MGSLFHVMQTLTHTLKELKNTLSHTVARAPSPPRHRKTLGWSGSRSESLHSGTRQRCGPRWWGGAVSLLPGGKVQRQGRGPGREGHLTAVGSGWAHEGPSWSIPEGLAHLAGAAALWRCPWAGRPRWGPGGRAQSRVSLQTPLQSMVLVRLGREDLVAHPPSRLDVASVARMRGFTTAGGS